MFYVFNKDKIFSYIISVGLVFILILSSMVLLNNKEDTVKTSAKGEKDENSNYNNIIVNNVIE